MDILKKYHRIYAKIDLDAIRENVKHLMAATRPGTMGLAVIKTDGYGHGAIPIAETISDLVQWFAVATVNEAMNLRKHGIKNPILVLGYTNESYFKDLIRYDITPAMYSCEMIKDFSRVAASLGKAGKIHIKVDTGMGRIGFSDTEESVKQILELSKLPYIEMDGIFTHFSKADEADLTHAKHQYERFRHFVDALKEGGLDIPVVHCSNSAGIFELPQANESMVRMGIALYGMYPSDEVEKKISLTPALSLYSQVTHIKTIHEGDMVSNGGTFVAKKDMQIATISAGYGDGYPRNLSNKGYVLLHGKKAPIIGRVCMDQFMIDISDIPDVKMEDAVTLVGTEGKETITVEELAELAGTFNYEFVCDLGKRIPRVYYKDGKIVGTKDYFDDPYSPLH